MRTGLLVVGLAGFAVGLLWIGQGTGVITWPASSFMVGQLNWALWGAVLTLSGLFAIATSRR